MEEKDEPSAANQEEDQDEELEEDERKEEENEDEMGLDDYQSDPDEPEAVSLRDSEHLLEEEEDEDEDK